MKKVLIVEDSSQRQRVWKLKLDGKIEIVQALTIKDAEFAGIEFDLIVMDCCVPGDMPNTMNLVKSIRVAGFDGPILANSSQEYFVEMLQNAGCDYGCNKDEVPQKVLEILGVE
ncbi:MAG: hypothetical protein A2312_01330 [Candidatus Staskawiczbacteria bacterium RIFOXYB2_FULL_32_9]|uniref:Response regulatory domain-containing protein n=1 Tax=Candidatus Staskawiczbacteria bacterium RIFOXYD1_FULL_32_13 TaxID=1802234 RepID=A0A1G2JRK2_9BACT|nr:MAG: hypothetical protein UR22_C0003G0050 [Parcubacteria group bacterium GW2011_GWC2_32_10]OGV11415.1 MAG: hypothetical protein A2237_00985 [Stygiobacter sp. RIFOXYA2_FULL_38_8]OGZ78383.1 MAG: hypothetical protein A2360_03640 [Candidatus Staskawiczbacteria bacterium RIFOXYB1_FULL_32_11]OGZ81355.1 MAG: hypothetical protein A2312_01330 [Candidatus Staskawiczbacteria bacterium RIFOXYB2_FULL_32_9]OGZ86745.1 MAG: hypothetical protein A2463_03875 [Candidatus Staskawiczbacteria bacterium RIFOXYC2_F